jgi:hypothetical protein
MKMGHSYITFTFFPQKLLNIDAKDPHPLSTVPHFQFFGYHTDRKKTFKLKKIRNECLRAFSNP